MSAGKVTVVQCLSQPLCRQVGREVAARVQYRGRGTASDQQSDARTHRHAAIQAYTQMAKQTRTKELKEKRGYLEIGWGTQPQQFDEVTDKTKLAPFFMAHGVVAVKGVSQQYCPLTFAPG